MGKHSEMRRSIMQAYEVWKHLQAKQKFTLAEVAKETVFTLVGQYYEKFHEYDDEADWDSPDGREDKEADIHVWDIETKEARPWTKL